MKTDRLPKPIQQLLRARRQRRFKYMMDLVPTWPGMKVLDVGCGIDGRSFSDQADETFQITGVDLWPPERVHHKHPNFRYCQQNAADLSMFADASFDLAISVGMLEHVTDQAAYLSLVREVQRVAGQYVFIVPYKWAWIEPHYGFPFFGGLPYGMQIWLIDKLNLCGLGATVRADPNYLRKTTRWLSNAEYLNAFLGARTQLLPTLETVAIVKALPAHVAAPRVLAYQT